MNACRFVFLPSALTIAAATAALLSGVCLAELSWTDKPAPAEPVVKVVPPGDSPEDYPNEKWTRLPYVETAPEFTPTEAETQRGYALFSRPLIDPVYPETRPLAQERIERLEAVGAKGQFVNFNFAIFPLRDMANINVRCGAFTQTAANPDEKSTETKAVLDQTAVQVRLVTYRGNRYPGYSSKDFRWRLLPEFLQTVTTSDAPTREPQRFLVTVHVPDGASAGKYQSQLLISDDGNDKSLVVPLELEVLPFSLIRDPNKGFSAYYYSPQRHELVKSGKFTAEQAKDMQRREFRVMRDYGFTRPPVYHIEYDSETKSWIFPDWDFWKSLMDENGFTGPMPVIGGAPTWICSKMDGVKFGSHLVIEGDKLPSEAFYAELARLCKDLKKKLDEGNYPEMVFGPLDEVSSQKEATEFGTRVYKTFQDAGLTTYTTKEPMDPTFETYDPYIDIFASQVFLPLYQEVVEKHKKAYWMYPNHNSYERKDPIIMNKGGRMTYGFGLWRSGFDFLVPWIWRNPHDRHFDIATSGGANKFNPETGDVIMTIYWENFREGIYDGQFLYTLEQAITERENSDDPTVQKLVQDGKRLLQEIWDSCSVEPKYLSSNLWASQEFDGRRIQMARAIEQLYRFPAANKNQAPSVIIEPRVVEVPQADPAQFIDAQEKAKNLIVFPVKNDQKPAWGWVKAEGEADVSDVSPADEKIEGAASERLLLQHILIDHVKDGSGSKTNQYPMGWPGMSYYVQDSDKLAGVRYLRVRYMVKSNRGDDRKNSDGLFDTPISIILSGANTFQCPKAIREGEWIECVFPLEAGAYDGLNAGAPIPSRFRTCVTESNYKHGDDLKFYFDKIELIAFAKPVLGVLECPRAINSAEPGLKYQIQVSGIVGQECSLKATLTNAAGETIASETQTLTRDETVKGALNAVDSWKPGAYQLKVIISNAQNEALSVQTCTTEVF